MNQKKTIGKFGGVCVILLHQTNINLNKGKESQMKFLTTTIIAILFTFFSVLAVAGPVNINTATAENLAVNIKGVGKKKAEAIIAYREANGPFKSVDDLQKVKGIGSKILQKNKENLLISSN